MKNIVFVVVLFLSPAVTCWSQSFQVIPLGVKGGSDESNLSSYALAVNGTHNYVCLDAGTIHYGIQKAVAFGELQGSVDGIIQNYIKGYLISHAHLDHVAGLVLNSPDDSPKPIYGLPFCLDILKDKYFTWKNWANFGNEGDQPTLNKYRYTTLSPDRETPLENTAMTARAFTLSHGNPYESSAFLIRHEESYILYLGDTGADAIEKSDKLNSLWKIVSPLIKSKKLKAIFIEVSFPDEQPENKLFGHLTPKLLMTEMKALSELTNGLAGFPVVITHRKPLVDREERIKEQLLRNNSLAIKLIFPEQGKPLTF